MCVRLTKLGEILTSDVISILTGIRGTREEVAVDIVRKAGSDLKEEERRLRNIHSGRRKGRKKARTAQTSRLGSSATRRDRVKLKMDTTMAYACMIPKKKVWSTCVIDMQEVIKKGGVCKTKIDIVKTPMMMY